MPTPPDSTPRLRIRSPGDFLWVARRHAMKGLFAFAAMFLLAFAAYQLIEPRFVSEAKILVRLGRESVRLDPTVAIGPMVDISESRRHEVNSEVGILASEDLLRGLLEAFPAEAGERDPIDNLRKRLRILPEEQSNIISIAFRHSDPARAQASVAKLLDLYLDKHIKLHTTNGGSAFFKKQAEQVAQRLAGLRSRLREARRAVGLHTVEAQRQRLADRASILTQEKERVRFDISVSEAKLRELAEAVRAIGEGLDREKNTVVRSSLHSNRQRLLLDLALERTQLAGLIAKREKLNQQQGNVDDDVDLLQRREGEIRALRDEVALLDQKHRDYLDSLEQSRIDDELGYEKISNIRIVQAATLPTQPSGPPRSWILILGIVVALLALIAAVVLADYLDDSLQTSKDVERRLGADVLAAVRTNRAMRHVMARRRNPKRRPKLAADVGRELELLAGRIAAVDAPTPIIAVTGAKPGVGASTLAFHLACRLAAVGRVLLVDADVGTSALSESLGVFEPNEPVKTEFDNVSVYVPVSNMDVRALCQRARAGGFGFSFVIMDLASITESLSAVTLARLSTGTVFVVDSQKSDARTAERGYRILDDSNVRLFGAVLNQHSVPVRRAV